MSFLLSLLAFAFLPVSEVSAAMADTQNAYQTAFLYFLPDYEPKEEVNKAKIRGCRKIGYTVTRSNCASPRILKGKCPVGNLYKECYCKGSPTCTGSTSSAIPYSSSIGASKTSCVDCPGNTLYTWTCSSSTCGSYSLGSCPSNGYCSQCCDGYYKLDSCRSGYHKSGNSCEKDCVPYQNETNCTFGTYTCSNGCGGTRTCCSADPCAGTSCPTAKSCSYGCKSYSSATSCCSSVCIECNTQAPHTHSYSCPYGYSSSNSWGSSAQTTSKSCSCGAVSGSCYKAPADPCAGITCSDGKICSNGSCVCPSGQCCPACTGGKTCSNGTCVTVDPCAGVTCPSGQTCSNGTCISTCVSGGSSTCSGQTSSCSSSQVQTNSCKDCDGNMHYSCRAKTCAEQGKKDCNGTCIEKSECCGGCSDGKTCQNGSCVCPSGMKTCPGSSLCVPAGYCCSDSDCSEDRICQGGSCITACVSGGYSNCSGQTTPCGAGYEEVYSCKDCSGTKHYSCKKVECVSGGSKNCSGQTSPCSTGYQEVYSCKDCSGTKHYSCAPCISCWDAVRGYEGSCAANGKKDVTPPQCWTHGTGTCAKICCQCQ